MSPSIAGNSPFYGCSGLTTFAVDAANPTLAAAGRGSVRQGEDPTHSISGRGKSGFHVVPDGVTNDGECAFSGLHLPDQRDVPESVTMQRQWLSGVLRLQNLTSVYFQRQCPTARFKCVCRHQECDQSTTSPGTPRAGAASRWPSDRPVESAGDGCQLASGNGVNSLHLHGQQRAITITEYTGHCGGGGGGPHCTING